MYPRWRSDDSGTPPPAPRAGDSGLGQGRQDLFAEPLLDLEQQLSAILSGASWAVVSFVPSDAVWCDWIYRCLNGYPLPVPLIDRVTPHGFPRPDCLSIFPDRKDPAYEDHAADALANSAYLIVVVSPDSAHAQSVDESIRAFKKAGGEERIIALVVDGAPDARLGDCLGVQGFEWLPAWLRWRCDEKGFCPADRSEPRVIDARRGFASSRHIRDALLAALVDMDAGELDRLGGFNRALPELQPVINITPSPMPPSFTTDFPIPPPEPASRRDAAFMIGVAILLIVVAVIFGVRSFRELSADEPQSMLAVSRYPVSRAAWAIGLPPLPSPEPEPEPVAEVVAEPVPPVVNVAAVLENSRPVAPVIVPAARPNLPQLTAQQGIAMTRLQPAAPAPAPVQPIASVPASPADDAVLLEEVQTLESHADSTMAESQTEKAFELYHDALVRAIEYAARKGANPAAKDQVVTLQRKIALLQVQNSSTAEARTTYQQARKTLLQLKAQGIWSRERAKQLDEMESRLLSLPRD
jgi:hypothetical protein